MQTWRIANTGGDTRDLPVEAYLRRNRLRLALWNSEQNKIADVAYPSYWLIVSESSNSSDPDLPGHVIIMPGSVKYIGGNKSGRRREPSSTTCSTTWLADYNMLATQQCATTLLHNIPTHTVCVARMVLSCYGTSRFFGNKFLLERVKTFNQHVTYVILRPKKLRRWSLGSPVIIMGPNVGRLAV